MLGDGIDIWLANGTDVAGADPGLIFRGGGGKDVLSGSIHLLSGGKLLISLRYYKETKIWVGAAAPHT
jgi:hypothetical protein